MSSARSIIRRIIIATPPVPRRIIGKLLKFLGISIETGFERHGYIDKRASLRDRSLITVGKTADVAEYCILRCYESFIRIGARSSLGPFCVIYAGKMGVSIGEDVMLAPYVMLASGNHGMRLSGPVMRLAECTTSGPIIIENNVWVGAHAVICDGVKIATGCVIGAGAIVTKSTEPNGIYAGVPARRIGDRPD
jgi:acetyltransferase-like isoleucine patch superfamily enzyme